MIKCLSWFNSKFQVTQKQKLKWRERKKLVWWSSYKLIWSKLSWGYLLLLLLLLLLMMIIMMTIDNWQWWWWWRWWYLRVGWRLSSSERSSLQWAPENTSLTWSSGDNNPPPPLYNHHHHHHHHYHYHYHHITMMFRVLDRDSSGTIGFMELMLTIELVGAVKYDIAIIVITVHHDEYSCHQSLSPWSAFL